jgi:hypothetical protein
MPYNWPGLNSLVADPVYFGRNFKTTAKQINFESELQKSKN